MANSVTMEEYAESLRRLHLDAALVQIEIQRRLSGLSVRELSTRSGIERNRLGVLLSGITSEEIDQLATAVDWKETE